MSSNDEEGRRVSGENEEDNVVSNVKMRVRRLGAAHQCPQQSLCRSSRPTGAVVRGKQ
jgi:hypothetical protein